MVESVGSKLKKTRLARGLTLEDAAHYTKIRARSLADLENDDYSNFPNLVYGRSFLVLYARYLGVDISEYLDQVTTSNAVSLQGYEYLATGKSPTEPIQHTKKNKRRTPAIPWPLIAVSLLVLLGVGLYFLLNTTLSRLDTAPSDAPLTPTEIPPEVSRIATPNTSPTPLPTPTTTPIVEEEPLVRRAIPADETAEFVPLPPSDAPEFILEIQALGTTGLQVIKDQRNEEPSFSGEITRSSEPLRLRGNRFWIIAENPDRIDIRKNGQMISMPGNELLLE